MAGPARTAFPIGGNPITSPGAAISFVYPDSGNEPAPVSTDSIVVLGFAFSEVGGSSPAKVRLHDGPSAAGPELAPLVNLVANGFQQVLSFPNGVQSTTGKVFVEVQGSGSVEIIVYW